MAWQVQEVKQRLSEVLRAVESDGPQTITRHGAPVAVMIDVAEYRRLTEHRGGFVEHLTSFPVLDDATAADVFDDIAAERAADHPREPV